MAHSRINNDLLRPLFQTTWRFYLLVGLFGTVVLVVKIGRASCRERVLLGV